MRALTIRQPWAWAISEGLKDVENRGWQTYYRGDFAIHAGTGVGARWEYDHAVESVAALTGLAPDRVRAMSAARGTVVAVANLIDVCSASLRLSFSAPLACDCGPWAQSGQRHLILADVRPIAEPVPVKGALGFWTLPDKVEAAAVQQFLRRTEAATSAQVTR